MKLLVLIIATLVAYCNAGPISGLGSGYYDENYVPNTPQNIAILNSGNYLQNTEELSGQYQGDILLTPEQTASLFGQTRSGLLNTFYRWPQNTIPYQLSYLFTPTHVAYIEQVLRYIESVSCLRFVRRTNEIDFVEVTGLSGGCFSHVGHLGGRQQINLELSAPDTGCLRFGTVIHEFLHAAGFYHMQSSTERDSYVRVAWENIAPGSESNFLTYGSNVISNYGVEYDVTSVMHYGPYGFSKNGLPTIIPYDNNLVSTMGQRITMSPRDVQRLNKALIESGNYLQNIEELSGQYQGDIVLTNEQESILLGKERTGLINVARRWPNNTVTYQFDENTFTAEQIAHIELGLSLIEEISCIRFAKRTELGQTDFVLVTGANSGCHSNVGYLARQQQVNFQLNVPESGCFRIGTIVHEFLHTLGFYHMQSASERDDWVRIAYEHIQSGTEGNFNKYEADLISNFGVDYDVRSVMHYSAYGFSKDGFATIIPNKIEYIRDMGQRLGMTDSDIKRLNAMYQCNL